jgi:hypothetical protein
LLPIIIDDIILNGVHSNISWLSSIRLIKAGSRYYEKDNNET